MNYRLVAIVNIPDWKTTCENILNNKVCSGKRLIDLVDIDECIKNKVNPPFNKTPQLLLREFESDHHPTRVSVIAVSNILTWINLPRGTADCRLVLDGNLLSLELLNDSLPQFNYVCGTYEGITMARIPITYLQTSMLKDLVLPEVVSMCGYEIISYKLINETNISHINI